MGVVSNLPAWLASPLIEAKGLKGLFAAQVYGDSGFGLKPSPRPIFRALSELGVPATTSALFVGDTLAHLEAAKAAGVGFVWCNYGYGCAPHDLDFARRGCVLRPQLRELGRHRSQAATDWRPDLEVLLTPSPKVTSREDHELKRTLLQASTHCG